MNFDKKINTLFVLSLFCTGMSCAHAAVSLDRTRAVLNGDEKSVVMSISNDNTHLPYLAQAWVEDINGAKLTTGPIITTPPVQRLDAGTKSKVRLALAPDASKLPQDRESLFYFNLREIPPKSEKANVLQIALQTKIKLFYRPASIVTEPNAVWQDKLILNTIQGGYRIENPTPYYVTIIGIGGTKKKSEEGSFDTVMIPPKSEKKVKTEVTTSPWLTYINDYGGRPTIQFHCTSSRCTAK